MPTYVIFSVSATYIQEQPQTNKLYNNTSRYYSTIIFLFLTVFPPLWYRLNSGCLVVVDRSWPLEKVTIHAVCISGFIGCYNTLGWSRTHQGSIPPPRNSRVHSMSLHASPPWSMPSHHATSGKFSKLAIYERIYACAQTLYIVALTAKLKDELQKCIYRREESIHNTLTLSSYTHAHL